MDDEIMYQLLIGQIKSHMNLKNFGKVVDTIKRAETHKKTTDLYMYGASATFKLDKWKQVVEFCLLALKENPDFRAAKEMMNIALGQQMREAEKLRQKEQSSKYNDILLLSTMEPAK
jgi:hypothetical protein